MDPIVHEVAKDYEQRVNVVYVDTKTSNGKKIAAQEGVRGIPTILLFNDEGKRIHTLVGARSRVILEQLLNVLLPRE